MKILLLIPSMAGAGGTERMVSSLGELLRSGGHVVHEASFDPPGTQRHFESETPLHCIGPIPRLPLALRPIGYVIAVRRLRALKKRLGVDVTISNLWSADFINGLCPGGNRIALCHINVVDNPTNRMMLRFRPLVASIYRIFDKVVAVSAPLRDELAGLYRLPEEQITAISNFTQVAAPENGTAVPDTGPKRFVWCGRFVPEKNLEGLMHVWSAFARERQDVQLVLLGDGPLRESIEMLARKLGLTVTADLEDRSAQVLFAGFQSDPASHVGTARSLVLTSLSEGLPMVVLEALATGTPVLAADCAPGGLCFALSDDPFKPGRADAQVTQCGALLPVPSGEDESTIRAWTPLLEAAADDEERLQDWRKGALARAQRFSPPHALKAWKAVLDDVS